MTDPVALQHRPAEVVCVVPFWSQSDALNWDSNYTYLRRTLPMMAAERPDWLWVVLWPRKSIGDVWRYVDDGLFQHPRIVRYPWPYHTSMSLGIVSFDAESFKDLEVRYAPTVYWCNQIEMAPHLLGGSNRSANKNAQPCLIGQHHYVIHKSLPYPMVSNWARRWLQTGGSLACDVVICNTDYTLQMMREAFAEWLNGPTLKSVLAKTEVILHAPAVPDAFDIPIRPHPKPVMLYNHRFESYKRPLDTLEVIKDLRAQGHEFELWVTQVNGQQANRFPMDRAVGSPDYMTYLRNIAVPAVNTTNTAHETFCISALDSLMMGHLLVAPKGLTFPELVPNHYPYLYSTPTEQRDMLAYIFRNWDAEIAKWQPVLRQWTRDKFDPAAYARAYIAVMQREVDLYRRPEVMKDHNWDKTLDYARRLKPGRYVMHDLSNLYRRHTGLMAQAMPDRRVVRELTNLGAGVDHAQNQLVLTWPGFTDAQLVGSGRHVGATP